jgi:hypothetical protein
MARAAFALGLLLAAGGAWAHAHLENAQPAAGSVRTDVTEVRLAFTEALEARLSSIRIEDREDRAVVEPAAAADPADAKVLVVHLYEKLPPGNYTVKWVAVASDGHRASGSYSFQVSAGPGR